jgi:hypothetical protein
MLDKILLIKDILELAHHFRKAILIILLIGLVLIFLLSYWIEVSNNEQEHKLNQIWNNIKSGDSIFIKSNLYSLDFYKKGRQKLDDYEQNKINNRRMDTLNFIKQNSVDEKYFYQNKTSFIGICLGKDSCITEPGKNNKSRWIKIKPTFKITHPPKSDKYDLESRKWENNANDYFIVGKLSKDFYIKFEDITVINNDSVYSN